MGLISMVGKIVIVIINILTLIMSLAMLVVGVIILAGKDVYKGLIDDIKSELKDATSQFGVNVNVDELSLSEFLEPIAYALIAFGIIVGAMSLIGCIGACYTIKIILIIYVVATGVVFLSQLIITIIVYADKSAFDNTVKSKLKDTLKDYEGIEDTSTKGLAWNGIMQFEKCCGVDGYEDFKDLDSWPPTTLNDISLPVGTDLETPLICCKEKSVNNYACAQKGTADDSNNYMHTGCYDKLWDLLTGNALVLTVAICILGFQAVLLFFAIWIICTMDNKIDII